MLLAGDPPDFGVPCGVPNNTTSVSERNEK